MSLFQRLITETQISNPPEPAMDHDLIKLMVLLPAIAIHFRSFRYETPCRTNNFDIEIIKEQVRSISTRNIIKIYAVLCFAMSLPVCDCYLC